MSETAAGSADFTHLWRSVSVPCHSKTEDKNAEKQTPTTATSPMCKDLLSPKNRGCSRYPGLNNADSPGDVEPTQDIFWDPTSPTHPNNGLMNTRVVEISEIVNRIAPQDVKQTRSDSPLLQWISDSAVPCTPDVPRVRKKSSRRSSVDLIKLARQFDENMQQDRETSEQLNAVNNNNLNECGNTSKTELTETSSQSNVQNPKCWSSSDQVEADLHALFDCSTQKVSGRLSQGSAASAPSQEVKGRPVTPTGAKPQQPELGSADKPGSAVTNCDNLDDDWDNDDLLNDPVVLAITQQHDTSPKTTWQSNTKTKTPLLTSSLQPTAQRPSSLHFKPSCSLLQELCPKPKTTNRSTFKLEPNPNFQLKAAAREESKSSFTVTQPKPQMLEQKSATAKTQSTVQPDKITNIQKEPRGAADSVKDISDSLWDDIDDDALLFQVCDNVERIFNSQVSPSCNQEKQDSAADRPRKTTAPVAISTAGSIVNRQPPCAFVRSNSLPGTSCEAVNYQGWNIPMKGANNKSGMSQSLPGSRMSLGPFSQRRDSSGTFQAGSADMKPFTVTAGPPLKAHHSAFKRTVSDSAAVTNKVFVTSQMTGKCSAAEIERKRQEALAKKRQRKQSAPKP